MVRFALFLDVAPPPTLTADFTTSEAISVADRTLPHNGKHYRVARLDPGEGRVYRVHPRKGAS